MIDSKLRFEIFKKDLFTCQYCGRSAPEVELQVEHIIAKANGGTDDIDNLMTSCSQCNYAKNANPISDKLYTTNLFEKHIKDISDIKKRKAQFELITLYKKELAELESMEVKEILSLIPEDTTNQYSQHAFRIKNLIKKYGFNIVYDATERCVNKLFDTDTKILLAWRVDFYLPIMCKILVDKDIDINSFEIKYLIEVIKEKLFDGYLKEIYNPEKDILPMLLEINKLGYHPKTNKDLPFVQILVKCVLMCENISDSKEVRYEDICEYINSGEEPCRPY